MLFYLSDQAPLVHAHAVARGSCFVIDDFEAPLQASFVVVSAHVSFLLQADSVIEKNEWVAALKATMDRCAYSALTPMMPNSSSGREAARQASRKKLLTATSADMSVASLRTAKTACATDIDIDNDDCGTTTGSNAPSSTKGGRGGEGHDDDRYESGGGAGIVSAGGGGGGSSYGGSSSASMMPPTSVSAWRSSSPSSPSSPSPSLSSDAAADTAAAAADGGGAPDNVSPLPPPPPPPPSTTTRWRQSMPRPLLVGSGRVRASYMLHKARGGGSSNDSKKSSAAGGVGGGKRQGGGTWKKRKGPVVRLVSHRTAGNTSFDRLAAEGRRSDKDNSDNAPAATPAADDEGGGSGGGVLSKPPRCPPSSGGGGSGSIHRDLAGQGNDEGCFKLEDISFWVACGPSGKAVRWETLRLDAPSSDEAWNGVVGFRRALADPACFLEFRKLLRSIRHASENLNFREAVVRYRALCYDCKAKNPGSSSSSRKHLKPRSKSADAGGRPHAPSLLASPWAAGGWRGGGGGGGGGGGSTDGTATATDSSSSPSSSWVLSKPHMAAAAARDVIVDRFVREGAPEQVNLSAVTREKILLLQKESVEDESQLSRTKPGASFFSPPELPPPPPPPSAELFEEAWDEVSKLLQRDAFAQFRNSEVFLRLKTQWGRQPNGVLDASEFVLMPSDGTDRAAGGTRGTRASSGLATAAMRPPPRTSLGSASATAAATGEEEQQQPAVQQGKTGMIDAGGDGKESPCCSSPRGHSAPTPSPVHPPPFPSMARTLTAATSEATTATPTKQPEEEEEGEELRPMTAPLLCPSFSSPSVSCCSSSVASSHRRRRRSGGPPPLSTRSSSSSSTSSRASIRSRLLSGLADHEYQQYHQEEEKQQQQQEQARPPAATATATPRERMFGTSVASAAAEGGVVVPADGGDTDAASGVGDSPPSFRRSPHVAVRETTAVVARPPPRGEAPAPGTKDREQATADKSAPKPPERLSGGRGSDGVGDDNEVADAWPWPVNPPRASPSCRGGKPHRFYYFHHQQQQRQERQQQQQHRVMPPLPLASSLRDLADPVRCLPGPAEASTPVEVGETSAAVVAAAAAAATLGGSQGVAKSARQFVRNMGAAEDLSFAIPAPTIAFSGSLLPPRHAFSPVPTTGGSSEEQLSVEAIAWASAAAAAAAAAEQEEGEGEEEEEEEEEGVDNEQGEDGENKKQDEEEEKTEEEESSPVTSPPLAPPRLDANRCYRSAGAAAAAATPTAIWRDVPPRGFRSHGGQRPMAGTVTDRAARAARAYAAAAAARQARQDLAKQSATPTAAAAAATLTAPATPATPAAVAAKAALSRIREEARRERINSTPGGRHRLRLEEGGLRRSPRHNKVQLLLQAPPGTGLGVLLADRYGAATIAGFRSSLDDNFDSVLGAGLRVGDVIVSVNDTPVRGDFNLVSLARDWDRPLGAGGG
ncbi:unnamed protein product, partial [Ectocarpus fasciculatus]